MPLNQQEQKVLDALVKAWNVFVSLEPSHPDDLPDFRRSIHECQRILATRKLNRIDPAWRDPEWKEHCIEGKAK